MDIQRIDWNATAWTKVREGVERKGFSGNGATIALNRLFPGHEPRPHSHPHEQIVYIVSGKARFHVGDAVVLLGADELLVVPPNVEHGRRLSATNRSSISTCSLRAGPNIPTVSNSLTPAGRQSGRTRRIRKKQQVFRMEKIE